MHDDTADSDGLYEAIFRACRNADHQILPRLHSHAKIQKQILHCGPREKAVGSFSTSRTSDMQLWTC